MPSAADVAKRQFLQVLREVAAKYHVDVPVSRESPRKEVERAYRKVAAKAHPDKGGAQADFQRLSASS